MAETATVPDEGTTILTEPIKEEPKPEEKLYPETKPVEKPLEVPDAKPADKAPTETKPPEEVTKPEEKTTAKPPEEYDLKAPEGSLLSAEDVAQTLKDAKAAGLTKEQAETLLTSKDQGAKALKTRQDTAFEQTKVQWKKDVENDPEMGGEKHTETVTLANRAFKTLASADLQIWAEKTGLGNYPEFVRLMAKVGRMMGEDRLIRGTVEAPETQKAPETLLYGKTTPGANGKIEP